MAAIVKWLAVRIIYSIFQRINLEWKAAPSGFLHNQLGVTRIRRLICSGGRNLISFAFALTIP